jgi:hypothetical protein
MYHRPIQHKVVTFQEGEIQRAPSPYFAPPVPSGMREPGTDYLTILTAESQVGPGQRA